LEAPNGVLHCHLLTRLSGSTAFTAKSVLPDLEPGSLGCNRALQPQRRVSAAPGPHLWGRWHDDQAGAECGVQRGLHCVGLHPSCAVDSWASGEDHDFLRLLFLSV
jgi:hypothetical protein